MGRLDEVEQLFADADAAFAAHRVHRLDILVNNAGITSTTPIEDLTEAGYDRTMAVNAKGVVFAMQFAARRMSVGGRIVNISTVGRCGRARVRPFTQRVRPRPSSSRGSRPASGVGGGSR
jgi:NAD(P)-dependent dehydrogenase (short-subunit alcohol dehydrogenase family)